MKVQVTLDSGDVFTMAAPEKISVRTWRRTQEIPCPDDPPCDAVHRKMVGRPHVTIRATGDSEWTR